MSIGTASPRLRKTVTPRGGSVRGAADCGAHKLQLAAETSWMRGVLPVTKMTSQNLVTYDAKALRDEQHQGMPFVGCRSAV